VRVGEIGLVQKYEEERKRKSGRVEKKKEETPSSEQARFTWFVTALLFGFYADRKLIFGEDCRGKEIKIKAEEGSSRERSSRKGNSY
jgi:hypothetical protein